MTVKYKIYIIYPLKINKFRGKFTYFVENLQISLKNLQVSLKIYKFR